MTYKTILFIALPVLMLVIGLSAFLQQQPSNAPITEVNNSHAFIGFPSQSVISTVIINQTKQDVAYPKVIIQKEQENIIDTKTDHYSNAYQVFYKIEKENKPTIDVLFEINKKKNLASIEVRNIPAQKAIEITNGTQSLYKNVKTDWVGNITIDSININNEICVTLNSKPDASSQICHTIKGGSHA